ncbi:hypothetical protein SBBP1_420071 [Burkholderiales bacterium]|nr:hypothetical protein SBBP1_420071 [Burkholderiales bacterium]
MLQPFPRHHDPLALRPASSDDGLLPASAGYRQMRLAPQDRWVPLLSDAPAMPWLVQERSRDTPLPEMGSNLRAHHWISPATRYIYS